jgi:hypothetical protein
MPDPTNTARQSRWRARKADLLPPVVVLICVACGGGSDGTHGLVCSLLGTAYH